MIKRNLIANFLGQGWAAVMSLAFIPQYIKYLGIESYGLIGLFGVLQAWLSLLDMGMTPTLNREMARFTAGAHSERFIRDLLRSMELIALGVALIIGMTIWSASRWLATDWLQAKNLPIDTVAEAVAIIGFVTASRFIEGIYRSAILGLQQQVQFNLIICVVATLRAVGAMFVLMWISPTIQAFFIWQGIVSVISLGLLAFITYKHMPKSDQAAQFSVHALRSIGSFASGMMGITLLGLLLTQIDKILLSKLLTLGEYGYYSLATMVASALFMLTGPIATVWFPILSRLHASNNQTELIKKYHQGAQLITVFMGSSAIILIIFSKVILQLWTQDKELSNSSANLLSLLALGNLLNGLMWIPYQTQLAYGQTRFTIKVNIVSILVIVPAIFWATPRFGAEGAAWVWVCLNAGYFLVSTPLMYRIILNGEMWEWYQKDVLQPLASAGLVAIFLYMVMPSNGTYYSQVFWLMGISITTLMAAVFTAAHIRQLFLGYLKSKIFINKKI